MYVKRHCHTKRRMQRTSCQGATVQKNQSSLKLSWPANGGSSHAPVSQMKKSIANVCLAHNTVARRTEKILLDIERQLGDRVDFCISSFSPQ